MPYNLVLSRRAETHIQSAYDWYEEQRLGLGEKFLDAIEKSLHSIQASPFVYGVRRKNIRGCIVKGFPYLVLFYLKENKIKVVAIFHMSRKPQA